MAEYKGTESIYNRLISVYNSCSNGMEGFEKILNIRDGLEGFRDSFKKRFFEVEIKKILLIHINNGIENSERRNKELKKINNYADEIFEEVSGVFFPWDESINDEDNFESELKEELEFRFEILQEGNNRTLAERIIEIFQIGKDGIEAYHLAGTEIIVMEALLIPDIINNNYPKTLKFDRNKESRLLNRLNKKLGAPLKSEVPQSEVEKIVTQVLKETNDAGRLVITLNGEKKAFKIIHKTGKRNGLANVNQISKYFQDAHPDLINMSMRQFKERIIKALPYNMKELNTS